jgi:preprotein translocase SecE subunit
VWPERNDVFKLTGVVSVFVLIMAFFMWGVDKVLEAILKLLTGV